MGRADIGDRESRHPRLWDILAAAPLLLLCAFGIAGVAIEVHQQWPAAGNAGLLVLIASEIAGALFLALQFWLIWVRRLPVAKAPGLTPRLWALLGANSAYAVLLLHKAALTPLRAGFSGLVICCGTLGAIFVLRRLGKSFAIFPQARMLVTGGPYRLVRHPLYLCEQISLFGVCLQYAWPWAFLIVLAGFALQFPRMAYEEDILARTFPRYRDYAARTPMIIPNFRGGMS